MNLREKLLAARRRERLFASTKVTAETFKVPFTATLGKMLLKLGANELGKYGRSQTGDALCAILPLSANAAYSRIKGALDKMGYQSDDYLEKHTIHPNEAYDDVIIVTDLFFYEGEEDPILFLTITEYTPKTSVVTFMVDIA